MQKFLSILLSILCILTLIGCNDAPPITNGDITTEAEIEQNMGTELEETPGTELEETLGTEAAKTAIIFPLLPTIPPARSPTPQRFSWLPAAPISPFWRSCTVT